MTLDEILVKENLTHVHDLIQFKRYKLFNCDRALEFMAEIREQRLKTIIIPDPDPDGIFAALCMKQCLERMGLYNHSVYELTDKGHGITDKMVSNILSGQYERVIIVDSSSNNMEQIVALCNAGIKVLIIDHHESGFNFDSYPEDCIVINPRIEMKRTPSIPYSEISACFACAMVCDYVLSMMDIVADYSYYIYGYITLYSDVCNLSNRYNMSIVTEFCKTSLTLPSIITFFMDLKYDTLCRSFISFKLIPRLNAMFRLGRFNLIHRLFFSWSKLSQSDRRLIKQQIEDTYTLSKFITHTMAEQSNHVEFDNMVVLQLDGLEDATGQTTSVIRNFTGLACQGVAEEKGKATFSLISMNDGYLQGSCRDPFGRNILALTSPLCKAGGHPSAFGIQVKRRDIQRWAIRLNSRLAILTEQANRQYFTIPEDDPNLEIDILRLADYNELSGTGGLPMIYLTKEVTPDMNIYKKDNYTSVMWGDRRIVCFDKNIHVGNLLYIKPTIGKYGVQLLVNTKM